MLDTNDLDIIELESTNSANSMNSPYQDWMTAETALLNIISDISSPGDVEGANAHLDEDSIHLRQASIVNDMLDKPSRSAKECLLKLRIWMTSVAPRPQMAQVCDPLERLAIQAISEMDDFFVGE